MIRFEPKKIPAVPGTYFFRDKHGKILYIGKAANLRVRIKSYFTSQPANPRLTKLLETAAKVTWQETDSEIEALILESQLIKKHRPPFNIMLRDDKQYFYIGFSNDKFPRVVITHQPSKLNQELRIEDQGSDQKNFNSKFLLHNSTYLGPFTDGSALKTTLRLLRRIFPYCTCKQKHNNYCLNYHIGKCLGFCCLKKSELRITKYELRNYENNIRATEDVLSGKRKGLIKKLKKEMVDYAKNGEFEKAAKLRDKIEKLEKIFQNAQILHNSRYSVLNSKNEINQSAALKELAHVLNLTSIPGRIEGYDVANIQGKFATGAMVVFVDGQPDKNQYRKFRVRTAQEPNDVAMLKEVLTRRFNHPEWPFPDLIVVDGGKAQLSAAKAALQESRIKNQKMWAIALTKNEKHQGDHVFVENKKTAMPLSKLPSAVRNLILQVDSEAHRFAIGYYRKLHKSSLGS